MSGHVRVYQGDTLKVQVTVYDEDSDTNERKNLNRAKVDYVITERLGRGKVLYETDLAGTVDIVDPSDGRVDVVVPRDVTENFPADDVYHEMEVADEFGNVSTVFQKRIQVIESAS